MKYTYTSALKRIAELEAALQSAQLPVPEPGTPPDAIVAQNRFYWRDQVWERVKAVIGEFDDPDDTIEVYELRRILGR